MQIGRPGIRFGEYFDVTDTNGVIGWVEPNVKHPKWILWFTKKGDASLWTDREPNGGIKGKPIRINAK